MQVEHGCGRYSKKQNILVRRSNKIKNQVQQMTLSKNIVVTPKKKEMNC